MQSAKRINIGVSTSMGLYSINFYDFASMRDKKVSKTVDKDIKREIKNIGTYHRIILNGETFFRECDESLDSYDDELLSE